MSQWNLCLFFLLLMCYCQLANPWLSKMSHIRPRRTQSFPIDMGGKVFENSKRMSRAEYDRIKGMLLPYFSQYGLQVASLVEIKDKETFGDIDFICSINPDKEFLQDEFLNSILKALESTEPFQRNNQYFHFLSKERYQIDIEFVPQEDFYIHTAVLSNGDFTWLFHVSLAKYKLLLSCNGLYLQINDIFPTISKVESRFLLSKDPNQIRSFLGLPHHALDGITSLSQEEIFTIISTNKFFSYDAFYKVTKNQWKVIQKKLEIRPLITAFYNWLDNSSSSSSQNEVVTLGATNTTQFTIIDDTSNLNGICSTLISTVRQEALQYFNKQDEFRTYVDAIQLQLEDNRYRQLSKSYINGTIIAQLLPQLSGPQIGEVLTAVRQKYGGPTWKSFHDWLAVTSQEDIHNCIIEVNPQSILK